MRCGVVSHPRYSSDSSAIPPDPNELAGGNLPVNEALQRSLCEGNKHPTPGLSHPEILVFSSIF